MYTAEKTGFDFCPLNIQPWGTQTFRGAAPNAQAWSTVAAVDGTCEFTEVSEMRAQC